MLDEYRRSFGEAHEKVVRTIRERLHLDPTGRPAKSTGSIIDKLKRESIRLSQVQDIAGCRIVVVDMLEQDRVVDSVCRLFPEASVVDRRATPSYGYRAVHVIASVGGRLVEIQIRSRLQHLWAELSEKFCDVVDPAIKYGGGRENIRELLTASSIMVQEYERVEKTWVSSTGEPGEARSGAEIRDTLTNMKEQIAHILADLITTVERGRPAQ